MSLSRNFIFWKGSEVSSRLMMGVQEKNSWSCWRGWHGDGPGCWPWLWAGSSLIFIDLYSRISRIIKNGGGTGWGGRCTPRTPWVPSGLAVPATVTPSAPPASVPSRTCPSPNPCLPSPAADSSRWGPAGTCAPPGLGLQLLVLMGVEQLVFFGKGECLR